VPCLLLFAVCAPGRYGDTCAVCVPGSYCPGGQDAPIVSCGSNRSSAARAPSQASCYCAPGEPLCQPVSINSSCPPRSASQQFRCDWCVTLCAQLDSTVFKGCHLVSTAAARMRLSPSRGGGSGGGEFGKCGMPATGCLEPRFVTTLAAA
jgi:hypothetical protein